MSETKVVNKDGKDSGKVVVKEGHEDKLAACCKSKAMECMKEVQEVSFVNGCLANESDQQLITTEWNEHENTVVTMHDLNKKTPAQVNWRNAKKDRNLDEVRNSIKKILSKAEDSDPESKNALMEALDSKKLITIMDDVLKVCRCIALLHLHHGLEFKHCKGMATMVASLTGELIQQLCMCVPEFCN